MVEERQYQDRVRREAAAAAESDAAAAVLAEREATEARAHSLRIGGATAALAVGVSPQLIRLMGRWSSDIYEIYCRRSMQSVVAVGRALAAAIVTPEGETFQDEHLEVLPSEAAQSVSIVGGRRRRRRRSQA